MPLIAGTVIHVPSDQPTIQAGIDAALNGDTVLVSAGTYYENINFNGKAITLTSASGPGATVIDGSKGTTVPTVTFNSGETSSSVISGFTIENQSSTGINVYGASPTITGNILTLNSMTSSCGSSAISAFSGAAALIQGNLISGNLTSNCAGSGAAISTGENSPVQIIGNVISANGGGAVSVYQATGSVNVSQNTITHNNGEGIFVFSGAGPVTVVQNLITGNQGAGLSWYLPPIFALSNTIANNASSCCLAGSGSEISTNDADNTVTLKNNLIVATGTAPAFFCGAAGTQPILTNNDVYSANSATYEGACSDPTGTKGNISSDPLFADLLGDDFHIQSNSPAVKAGTTSAPDEPKTDLDGDPRVIAKTIDIGADEYTLTTLLTLSTHALHYSSRDVGTTSAPQVVILTSKASKAIALKMLATGASYTQTNTCGTSLAAGASCQINVSFAPVLGGTVDGVLGIFSDATVNPLAVSLVGTGLAPQVQLPCCYYFPNQVIGTPGTQTNTLTNTGQGPLTITSVGISGSPDFVESDTCPKAPKTLAAGASCSVKVIFTPSIIGNEDATIIFNDNALPSPQTLDANGSGVSAGVPAFLPIALTFPTTLIGQSSSAQTATLTNTGTGPLGITSVFAYGDFPETNNCPTSLAVGASCTVNVTFVPSSQGNESGSVTVYTDSAVGQASVSLSGTGQALVPSISSLSVTTVPASSSAVQVTITGTGFVEGSQVLWNGAALPCCTYESGGTQINFTAPEASLATPGTYSVAVFTPTPGGGLSQSLPFVVYQPINYAVAPTKYSYRTITGTSLNLFNYGSAQITSPFPIQFGGGSFTNLTVGAGGTISFSGFASQNNDVIPTSQTTTLVAPFWANLFPFVNGNNNNVFWEVNGTVPSRVLVVEWRNVPYCCANDTTDTIKFQVVFFEGSSNIQFNYADTVFGGPYTSDDNGATATAGIQVSNGVGMQYSYDQPSLKSKTSLLWYPGSPTATVSTGNLSFGYHQIGGKSLPQKVTLTNGSHVALAISSISIANGDFQQTNNCGTSLGPQKSCSIQVVFDPSSPLAETTTLVINDNATNTPQTVELSGIGSVTPILVYPILVNFGGVTLGQTSTIPVVLANAVNTPLAIQEIVASPSVYSDTNNCGATLAPGRSCTVNVTFAPAQKGNVTGNISMGLNGKPAVTKVQLVGSGQ